MLPRFAHFWTARLTVLATSSMPARYVGFVEFSSHRLLSQAGTPLGVVCAALTTKERTAHDRSGWTFVRRPSFREEFAALPRSKQSRHFTTPRRVVSAATSAEPRQSKRKSMMYLKTFGQKRATILRCVKLTYFRGPSAVQPSRISAYESEELTAGPSGSSRNLDSPRISMRYAL